MRTQFKDLLSGCRFVKIDGFTYVKLAEPNTVGGTEDQPPRIVNAYLERPGEQAGYDDYVWIAGEALVTPLPDTPSTRPGEVSAEVVSIARFRTLKTRGSS